MLINSKIMEKLTVFRVIFLIRKSEIIKFNIFSQILLLGVFCIKEEPRIFCQNFTFNKIEHKGPEILTRSKLEMIKAKKGWRRLKMSKHFSKKRIS